jgi:WD40 repeat protein
VFDLETNEMIAQYPSVYGNAAVFSSEGYILTDPESQASYAMLLRDVLTGEVIITFEGHTNSTTSAILSPDGTRLLTTSYDFTARLWDIATGQPITSFLGHTDWVNSAAFSADGSRIVTASRDGTARIWDTETGNELRRYSGNVGAGFYAAVFSADGQQIITGDRAGNIRFWNALLDRQVRQITAGGLPILAYDLLPNGEQALVMPSGSFQRVQVWDSGLTQRQYEVDFPTSIWAWDYSADGRYVGVSTDSGILYLLDAQTGEILHELTLPQLEGAPSISVDFSPDGTRVASAHVTGLGHVWDVQTGTHLFEISHDELPVRALHYTPDGAYIISFEGTVVPSEPGDFVRVWHGETGDFVRSLGDEGANFWTVVLDSTGTRMATASASPDFAIRIWDFATGELQQEIALHAFHLQFSDDGETLLIGTAAGDVVWWNIDEARRQRTIQIDESILILQFSPDEAEVLVTTGSGRLLRLENDIADTIAFACSRLYSDIHEQLRSRYGIDAESSTCESFAVPEVTPEPGTE